MGKNSENLHLKKNINALLGFNSFNVFLNFLRNAFSLLFKFFK